MLVKILVIIVMLIIAGTLGSGLYYLVHDAGRGDRTVKALTWRIVISLILFILLLLGFAFNIITPHGID